MGHAGRNAHAWKRTTASESTERKFTQKKDILSALALAGFLCDQLVYCELGKTNYIFAFPCNADLVMIASILLVILPSGEEG